MLCLSAWHSDKTLAHQGLIVEGILNKGRIATPAVPPRNDITSQNRMAPFYRLSFMPVTYHINQKRV
jgi:hypothetical protein